MVMAISERICKRPTTVSARQKLTDKRVLEALERETALGVELPDHLKKIRDGLKGVKA